MGIPDPERVPCNYVMEFDITDNFKHIKSQQIYQFDLKQHKTNYEDWKIAMKQSIKKRCANTSANIFVPLSSGYDSGLICCMLREMQVSYNTIYLNNGAERTDIVQKRFQLNNTGRNHHIGEKNMDEKFKDYLGKILGHNSFIFYSTVASIYICHLAKTKGYKINLSGSGADELISDYYGGTLCGNFGGVFPQRLEDIFPRDSTDKDCVWKNFYSGEQSRNLNREEMTAGIFGIETRYPFLDRNVVQEFLWLDVSLKNKLYKAPIHEYLKSMNYPFDEKKKTGLTINDGTVGIETLKSNQIVMEYINKMLSDTEPELNNLFRDFRN